MRGSPRRVRRSEATASQKGAAGRRRGKRRPTTRALPVAGLECPPCGQSSRSSHSRRAGQGVAQLGRARRRGRPAAREAPSDDAGSARGGAGMSTMWSKFTKFTLAPRRARRSEARPSQKARPAGGAGSAARRRGLCPWRGRECPRCGQSSRSSHSPRFAAYFAAGRWSAVRRRLRVLTGRSQPSLG